MNNHLQNFKCLLAFFIALSCGIQSSLATDYANLSLSDFTQMTSSTTAPSGDNYYNTVVTTSITDGSDQYCYYQFENVDGSLAWGFTPRCTGSWSMWGAPESLFTNTNIGETITDPNLNGVTVTYSNIGWIIEFPCDVHCVERQTNASYSTVYWGNLSHNPGEITASINLEGSGEISGTGIYDWGSACTLTATSNEGFIFLYWIENGTRVSYNAEYTFTVAGDRNLEAHFAEEGSICNLVLQLFDSYGDGWNDNKLVVTYGDGTSEEITLSGESSGEQTLTVINGDHITLTWIKGSYIGECSFIVSYTNGNIICHGENMSDNFSCEFDVDCEDMPEIVFEVTASAEPSEGGTVTGAGTYYHGDVCTLTATSTPGYSFVNWTEDGEVVSDEPEYEFVVQGERFLIANFELESYEIEATAYPIEGGEVDGSGTYFYGETVTLVVTANEGYTFVNWTEDGEEVSNEPEYEFEVDGERNLVAHFELIRYEITAVVNPTTGGSLSFNKEVDDTYDFENGSIPTHWDNLCSSYPWKIWNSNPHSGSYCIASDNHNVHSSESYIEATVQFIEDGSISFYSRVSTEDARYDYGCFYIDGIEKLKEGGEINTWTAREYDVSAGNHTFRWSYHKDYMVHGGEDRYYIDDIIFTGVKAGVNASYTYTYGEICVLTATPNEGFTFVNWTEGDDEVSDEPILSFTVTADRTLVANFELESYEIEATADPIEGGEVEGSGTYYYGETATLTAIPHEGYVFWGWTEDDAMVSDEPIYEFEVYGDRILFALFDPEYYEIYASAEPSEGGEVEGGGTYYYGETATLVAIANPGYSFVNWTKEDEWDTWNVSCDPEYEFEVYGDMYLTAHFELESYEIEATADPIEGGEVEGSGTYYYGETVTLVATANEGYSFVNWTEDGEVVSDEPEYEFEVDGGRNLVANFELESYEIIATAEPFDGGEVDGSGIYLYGETITVTATANEGYTFINWTEDGEEVSDEPEYEFEVNGERNLVANFELESYEIEATADPIEGGEVEGDGTYYFGETASLTAIAFEGYTFVNWTENGEEVSNDANYSFVVTDDRTLVANYSHNSHNISASAYPAEEGMVYGDGVYYYGEECTLTAIANEGFVFINWTEDGVVVSNDADYYFIVEGDRSLVANFALYNTHVVHLYGGTEGIISTLDGQTAYYPNENVVIIDDEAICMHVTGITVYKTGDYNVIVPTNYDPTTGGYSFQMPAFDVDVYANSWSANEHNVYYQLYPTNSWNYAYFEGPEIAECGSEVNVTLRNHYSVGCVLTNLSVKEYGHHDIPITINSSNSYITHFSFIMPDDDVTVTGTLDSICLGQLPDVCQYQAPGEVYYYFTDVNGSYHGLSSEYYSYCQVMRPDDYHWEYYYSYYDNGQMFDQPGTWQYRVVITNRYGTFYSETKSFEVYPATLYTIDANSNPADGGEVSGTGIYPVGEECPFTECTLTAYTNEGYTFENWTENGTVVSSDANYSFTVSRNRTLLANFIPNSYEITASAYPEEGGTVSGGGTFNYGETVSLSAIANGDYVFLNWTENGNVVSTDANYSFTVTGDRTLVANFVLSYEITIESNPPEGGSVMGEGSYYYGEECTLIATANGGYYFVSWTEDGEVVSYEPEFVFEVYGDRNLVANFEHESYEIIATAEPLEGGEVYGSGTYYYGETVNLTATPFEGYVFLYWTEDGEEVSYEPEIVFEVYGERILVANFEPESYEIIATAEPLEGGEVYGSGTYYYGETVTLTATPFEGYAFLYWTENGTVISDDADYSFEVTEDRYLEAHFAEEGSICNLVFFLYDSWGDGWNGNKLVVSRGDETSEEITLGSGSSGEQAISVINGDHITLTWIKGSFINECSFIVSYSNGNIISHWENLTSDFSYEFDVDCENMPGITFMVMASAEPSEGGTVSGAGSYGYNANCTLTATANEGYTFMYWTENGTFVTSEAEYSFIVNGDRELVANFTLPFTITVEVNPMEGGTVAGAGSYDYGSTCTLSAIPDEGYDFLYWSENGTVISVDAEYSFEVTEDKNMEAHFAEEGSMCNLVFSLHDSYGDGWTGNKLVVTHGDETSDEITLDSGSSGDQIFFVLNGDHITLAWINGDYPEDCSFTVSYSNGNVICRGANLTSDFSYEFDVDCEDMPETVFVVTASAEPLDGGSVTGAGTYYPGDVCTLTATANPGYVFIYWTKDGAMVSSNPTLSFEVTGPATYVAYFMSFQFNVSATVTPEGAGMVTGTGTYSLGATCTLTATANEGYAFVNWTLNGTVVGTEPQYSFAVSSAVTLVANFERTTVTQQVTLSTGWNWFSSYIDPGDPIVLLDMLKEALDDNALEIQSYDDNTECMDGEWFGGLDDIGIDNAQTYMILAANDCTIEMEGLATDPANYPITLHRGWNWIGFPCAQEVSVADAFAGFEPEEGDVLQSYDNMTEFDGEDWWGELETLVPGQGLMYYSMSDEPKELVFQTGSGRAGRTDGTVSGHDYDLHYKVVSKGCASLYTTLTGVLTVNGLEQRNGALEIGVFDQYGICRAAKLPMYRSKTDQWIYQLQIKGAEGFEYTFRVFDHESGTELDLVPDMEKVVYDTQAPFGSLDDPYLFAFVSTIGVDENIEVVNLYPNPADKEERVRMELPSSMVPVGAKVEVYDALGKLITTGTVNGSDVELEGMKVSGLYTVKVTDRKGNVCYGKLVVK